MIYLLEKCSYEYGKEFDEIGLQMSQPDSAVARAVSMKAGTAI
jgi:hypothetical protein